MAKIYLQKNKKIINYKNVAKYCIAQKITNNSYRIMLRKLK